MDCREALRIAAKWVQEAVDKALEKCRDKRGREQASCILSELEKAKQQLTQRYGLYN